MNNNLIQSIKEWQEEISKVKKLDKSGIEALIRYTAWVHKDCNELLKQIESKKGKQKQC